MPRFDEIELQAVPIGTAAAGEMQPPAGARRLQRVMALLTDLSLFAALTFALLPLIPESHDTFSVVALAGFIVIVSYYYFVGSWMLWGKTIGGTIFDVRVAGADGESVPLWAATLRWAAVWISLLTAGLGFVVGLPDRMSDTTSM